MILLDVLVVSGVWLLAFLFVLALARAAKVGDRQMGYDDD